MRGFTLAIFCLLVTIASVANAEITLVRGHFIHSDAPTPPPEDAGWELVTLPDDWFASRPELSGLGWYRLEFELTELPRERQAVYLQKVNQNAAVYVNGEWIGQGGSLVPPVAQNWNRPAFYGFSPAMLKLGTNQIDVQLYRLPYCFGQLGSVILGNHADLQPRWEAQFNIQVLVARYTTILGAFVTLVMLAFLFASRDPAYGYFGLTVLFWTIGTLNYHVRDIPVSSRAWENLVSASIAVSTVPLVLFVHALRDLERPKLDAAVVAFGVLTWLTLFLIPKPWFHTAFNAALVVTVGLGVLAFYEAIRTSVSHSLLLRLAQLGGGFAAIGMSSHDLGIQLGALTTNRVNLTPFAGPVVITWYALMLLVRFVRTLKRAANQNVELERNIREKRTELEENFERLRELERERVVLGERERIMREVHDGLGGQLVRTLALVEAPDAPREEIATSVRAALDDMRLVINSLDPLVDDLPTLLGVLRGRLEPNLVRQGLRFEWRAGDLPPTPLLGPDEFLHILRIVQEAVTNVLKHAKASYIRVTSGERRSEQGIDGLFIVVRDDGVGIAATTNAGRGRANMAYRAQRLRGTITVRAAPEGGTLVDLWIPLGEN